MSIIVEGGSWKKGRQARVHNAFLKGPDAISLPVGLAFGMERVAGADLASVQVVTEQMRREAANKVSAGFAGGVLLGPLGLLAGVLIARGERHHLVILEHLDGRGALLRCNPVDLPKLLALTAGVRRPVSASPRPELAPLHSGGEPLAIDADASRVKPPPAGMSRPLIEAIYWLGLVVILGLLLVVPVLGLAACLLTILAGVIAWRRPELRQRVGRMRAGGLIVTGVLFLPSIFSGVTGSTPSSARLTQPSAESAPSPIELASAQEATEVAGEVADAAARPEAPATTEPQMLEAPREEQSVIPRRRAGAMPEGAVGRWCDGSGAFKRELTILRLDGPSFVLVSRYDGGQVDRTPLDVRGSSYGLRGSEFGEQYRVTANGALQLSDDEGPIRVDRAPSRRPFARLAHGGLHC